MRLPPRGKRIDVLFAMLALSWILMDGAVSHAAAADDLARKIDALEREVAATSSAVCGSVVPADPDDKALFDLRKALLAQAAKNLVKLLEQEKSLVDQLAVATSGKAMLKQSIEDEQKSLQADCPALTAAVQKTAAGSGPGPASPPSPPDKEIVVSKEAIVFPDKEVGDSAEASFTITNKGQNGIGLAPPQICDETGQRCDRKSEAFAFQPADEPCPSYLANTEHCGVKVVFNPTYAGRSVATVKVPLTDSMGNPRPKTVQLIGKGDVSNIVTLNGTGSVSTPSFRSVVGLDVSGASSAQTQQKAFVEFDMNAPLGLKGRDPLNRALWGFFNPRITSLPQESSALSSLNVQGFTDFFTAKKTDLVQGVDVQGGAEWLLVKPRSGIPFFSSYKNTRARTAVALVAGIGFTTPFSTPGNNPTVFTLPPDSPLRTQFNVPTSPTFSNIAFVNRERSRFFRKYYTGLRLKTYHFSDRVKGQCDPDQKPDQKPCEGVYNLFPGVIDVTAGQDEQVTAGHLSGWVFRLDAIYPLPFATGFHIFGSLNSAIQKNKSTNALILPPTSTTSISDPSVFIVNVDPRNRDIYRLGLGVDILQVLKKASSGSKDQEKPESNAGSKSDTKTGAETKTDANRTKQ